MAPEKSAGPCTASPPPSCRHSHSTSALKRTPETQRKVISTLGGQPAPREKGCSSLSGTPRRNNLWVPRLSAPFEVPSLRVGAALWGSPKATAVSTSGQEVWGGD